MIGAGDERLVEAFVAKAQQGLGLLSPEQLEDGWERLRAAPVADRPPVGRRSASRTWLFGFATASALAILALVVHRALPPPATPPLRYVLEGTAVANGNTVSSLPGEPARLRFSDASRVDLGPATKVSVAFMDARGARVEVLDGSVEVDVQHRADTAWQFTAGPFRVLVKGTAFRLDFDALRATLSLRMTKGLVEVSAPPHRTLAVGAGESVELQADLPRPETGAPANHAPTVSAPAPAAPEVAPASTRVESPRLPVRRTPPRPNETGEAAEPPPPIAWSGLLATGNFSGVVADAERRGLDKVLYQASAAELASLADSARYTRRYALAQKVLLTIRARFQGTEPAKDASFFLGRLAESGGPEAAVDWYDTYLREAPRGLYASETLGREMTLLARTSPAQARKIARAYLGRFPHGPQAELARSLLESE
jgi:hypothetical protein